MKGVEGKIILKVTLKLYDEMTWIEFVTGILTGCCEYGNEYSYS